MAIKSIVRKNIEANISMFDYYNSKAENHIIKILEEIALYTGFEVDDFIYEVFPGDGLGITLEDDRWVNTYVPIEVIIEAIENKEVLNRFWFENNESL
jgi:hypothetical protein